MLYATAECAPFIKQGGLGDVARALPKELAKKGVKTAVVMPLYKSIKDRYELKKITEFGVPLSWRCIYCGVFRLLDDGVEYYFIDNEYYFYRDNVYGDYDDGERFAYFSKAVLEMLGHINFVPDIIHANDWQCALIPLFYIGFYKHINHYSRIKTMFTIHNIEYQGKVPLSFLKEVIGMDEWYSKFLYYNGCINLMRSALLLADKVTTVSQTYAHEVAHEYFGEGLSPVIREVSYKTCGITNGIDTDNFNPKTDKALYNVFGPDDLRGRAKGRKKLREALGLFPDEDIAILAIITRLVPHKGVELIECVIDDIMSRNLQLIVLGTGYPKYENLFREIQERYPGRVSTNITFDSVLASRIYAAANMFLMPSKAEPCGLSQMIAMRYGAIPIVRETGGLFDSVPPINMETLQGRGFTFKSYNAHDMLGAVDRALCMYYDRRAAFNKIVKNNMRTDFGWSAPADQYIALYESM